MWNEEIDKGALVITLNNEKAGSVATVGYTPSKFDYCAGRNWMRIDYNYADDATYAHEMGHVFGLMHEHQRPDRDKYIDIKCSRIQGYDQALAKAQLDGHTVDELCNNAEIARKYGFMGATFTIYDNPMNGQVLTRSKNYDIDSIMHYTSTAAADDKHQSHPGDSEYYPLRAWAPGGLRDKLNIIKDKPHYPNYKITDLDAHAIKLLYPWKSPSEPTKTSTTTTPSPHQRHAMEVNHTVLERRMDFRWVATDLTDGAWVRWSQVNSGLWGGFRT